jgi:hypothetical protein
MYCDKQNPAKAYPETIARYQSQAADALDRGHPAEDLIGCLRYVASMRDKMGKNWHIKPLTLSERIGPWQEMPGKPTTYKPSRSNGHRQQQAAPFVPGGHDPTPNAPEDAVMCWCNTLEGYQHGRGCGLDGLVTRTNHRDNDDWTRRHTPRGVVIDEIPETAQ